jgi:hypothetical protein
MKKLLFCLAAGIFICSGTAFAQTSVKTQPQETNAKKPAKKSPFDGIVKFKKETVDFGTTKLNDPVTVEFKFTNVSDKPLIIKSAQPSCGCTTPDWTKKPVLPGKQGMVKATYNASALGQTNKTVFVNFQGIPQTLQLHLTGEVVK